MKIEKCTILIKGKEYNFLKPTAIELIDIEDQCFGVDGSVNQSKYNDLIIGLVSKKISAKDLVVFNSNEVELSNGEKLTIPEIGYDKWLETIEDMGSFSRIKLAKNAVYATGVSGEINLSGFKYEDIDALAMAYFSLYDLSELKRVVDEVTTFCFS